MPRFGLFLIPLLTALVIAACASDNGGGDTGDGNSRTSVLASNAIVADWVHNVAGDRVEVDTIIPPGADLHTYQLSPSGIRAIADAGLIFLVGAGLESSFEDEVNENANGTVIELTEGLDLAPFEDGHEHEDGDDHEHDDEESHDDEGDGHAHEDEDDHGAGEDDHGHDHGTFDPHIWMDPELAVAAVERIAAELAAVDPDGAAIYTANAEAYVAEIREMDAAITNQLVALSPEQKLLVTFHDAYGYFAGHYGLTVLGFVVENADEEPSAARVADLIQDIREHGAVAIYREPQFNAAVVDQVAAEAGVPVRLLPSDTLNDDHPTYIELMHAIANAIAA